MNLKSLIRKAKQEDPRPNLDKTPTPQNAARPQVSADTLAEPEDSTLALPSALMPKVTDCHLISRAPPSVWVLEDWLPPDAEDTLLRRLRARSVDFVQLRGKRTAMYGGPAGPPFVPEPLPSWLEVLCTVTGESLPSVEPASSSTAPVSADSVGGYDSAEAVPLAPPASFCHPNHVLVNLYRGGEGIMPHTDGPAYQPRAAILSLGSATVFDFWKDHEHTSSGRPPVVSILLPPRSLLVFSGEAYSSHLHGIRDQRYDDLSSQLIANWTRERLARWNCEVPLQPDWARQQLKVDQQRAVDEDDEGSTCRSGTLKRDERYSLTLRHVPLSLMSSSDRQ